MVERWFIVERLEEDWIFYFWCSENQAAADAGVVILGRERFDSLIGLKCKMKSSFSFETFDKFRIKKPI
jgi:hypothetical protein